MGQADDHVDLTFGLTFQLCSFLSLALATRHLIKFSDTKKEETKRQRSTKKRGNVSITVTPHAESTAVNEWTKTQTPGSTFLLVNLYQPSSSTSLKGNKSMPKKCLWVKNESSNKFQPITTPPHWFLWGDIGWYWLLGVSLCFTKSFPTKARTSKHTRHTSHTQECIGVQTRNKTTETVHTDNPPFCGWQLAVSLYQTIAHKHTHADENTVYLIGWCEPLSTCRTVGPNKLSCTLHVSVCVLTVEVCTENSSSQ